MVNSMKHYEIDIEKIIKKHGLDVDFFFSDEIEGVIKKDAHNVSLLYNNKRSKHRQRFAMAHMFAHYLQGDLENKNIIIETEEYFKFECEQLHG